MNVRTIVTAPVVGVVVTVNVVTLTTPLLQPPALQTLPLPILILVAEMSGEVVLTEHDIVIL